MNTGPKGHELVAALDSNGTLLPQGVSRSEAHQHGIWHRSISVFVVNRCGEILMERRSMHKDLFPGFYDILGGHVQYGQTSLETARQELREELRLEVSATRLKPLAPEDAVFERVVLPDRGIVNLERKTVYLLQLAQIEEEKVERLAAELLRLSLRELEERGTSGEVSEIDFWSWEQLCKELGSSQRCRIASGTRSAMSDASVHEEVGRCCSELRHARRCEFAKKYAFLKNSDPVSPAFDARLFDHFLDRPALAAPIGEVHAVFEKGANQPAGAYELGSFRRIASGDEHWGPKVRDPETRYVSNLLAAIGTGQSREIQRQLERVRPEVQLFVSELLNLPLTDGTRFRDGLGNLADIAVARKAALVFLEHVVPDLSSGILGYPTDIVTKACLQAGRHVLTTFLASAPRISVDRFRELALCGLGAATGDFNNPTFQGQLKSHASDSVQLARFFEQSTANQFSEELGADRFLVEFHKEYIESGVPVAITYLAGNSAQAAISLAIAQEILRSNEQATLRFVAKSGTPGSDLTITDANELIVSGEGNVYSDLARFMKEGRFSLESDGPQCHGLDPSRLSGSVSRALAEAQVILAEGQAYAEIRGWKKPVYIAFRVNGRVAEAIHGVSRKRGVSAFVRLTPGVDHFQDFSSVIKRKIVDQTDQRTIPVAAQTTTEYVNAILGENLDLLVRYVFHGNRFDACRQIQGEADRLGKTFAQILTGAASTRPDLESVTEALRNTRFPVFACGGGGGFNSVTLRALRMLGLPTVAGVPSTDDGGSTGELQRWLREKRGFVFGVGDMAAILEGAVTNRGKQAVLAYRFNRNPESLTSAVMERILAEMTAPTYPDSPVGAADDFLSFTCDQLNLARIIEKSFRGIQNHDGMPIKGASIRNLNVIAAYELCGMLGDRIELSDQSRLAAFHVLQRSLGLPTNLLVMPVTYSEGVLFLEYEEPISSQLTDNFKIPDTALANGRRRLYGQHYIDILPQPGSRLTAGVVKSFQSDCRPPANPEYLARLREADLFVMGAGSLVGSQLSQLSVPGVVDALLEQSNMRRILVLNHVKMDETLGMSLRDQIRLIETVAAENVSPRLRERYACSGGRMRIGDVFTDIVAPRTIARELEMEMTRDGHLVDEVSALEYVDIGAPEAVRVFQNRYVKFLLDNPELRKKYGVTIREIEVLSYLDQPVTLYNRRSEGGRYRGALFATAEDIEYLVSRGIQRRAIHEVDCVGENWKIVKAEGEPSLEFFPGLVPEALMGIFRIALERAGTPRGTYRT
jgi:isopentenyl-diphosphate Delta-isomerase